jgi:hypothetical protein
MMRSDAVFRRIMLGIGKELSRRLR